MQIHRVKTIATGDIIVSSSVTDQTNKYYITSYFTGDYYKVNKKNLGEDHFLSYEDAKRYLIRKNTKSISYHLNEIKRHQENILNNL